MRKVSTLFMILIIGVMFISCDSTTENNEIDVNNNSNNIFEQNFDGLLLVTNNDDEDLVLFYDFVQSANLIGGIKGGAIKHRVKLPETEKMYVIYVVKYSEYETVEESEISNLKVVCSTLIYSNPTNETTCELNTKYAGDCEIIFENETEYYIEIGNGSKNKQDVFCVIPPYSKESVFVSQNKNGHLLYIILNNIVMPENEILAVQRIFSDDWCANFLPTSLKKTIVSITSGLFENATGVKEEVTYYK